MNEQLPKKQSPIKQLLRELNDQFWHEGVWILAMPGIFPVVVTISYLAFKHGGN